MCAGFVHFSNAFHILSREGENRGRSRETEDGRRLKQSAGCVSSVYVQITAPALVSSRIYIPLSHQLERFFGLVSV